MGAVETRSVVAGEHEIVPPSIRPRHGSRGDHTIEYKARLTGYLQFGHGMGAVETSHPGRCQPPEPRLQFGHGMGAVETWAAHA